MRIVAIIHGIVPLFEREVLVGPVGNTNLRWRSTFSYLLADRIDGKEYASTSPKDGGLAGFSSGYAMWSLSWINE
jgi:hypothetical protein